MKWFRYIFKVDAVYTDLIPCRHLLAIFLIFLGLFIFLDLIYIFTINIFNLDSLTYSNISLVKYFAVPILTLLAVKVLDFMSLSFVVSKRQYQAKDYQDHTLRQSAILRHFIYDYKYLEVDLIKEDKSTKFYDLMFTANYKGAYISHCQTVAEVVLPKKVPHVILDSIPAKGQQFKAYFKKASQVEIPALVSMFEVHANQDSNENSLKFLKSKTVIDALVDLKDCDIEFKDNRLICYAPVLNNDVLERFVQLVKALSKALETSLKGYRLPRQKASLALIENQLDRILVKNSKRQSYLFVAFLLFTILILIFLNSISSNWNLFFVFIYSYISIALFINAARTVSIHRELSH